MIKKRQTSSNTITISPKFLFTGDNLLHKTSTVRIYFTVASSDIEKIAKIIVRCYQEDTTANGSNSSKPNKKSNSDQVDAKLKENQVVDRDAQKPKILFEHIVHSTSIPRTKTEFVKSFTSVISLPSINKTEVDEFDESTSLWKTYETGNRSTITDFFSNEVQFEKFDTQSKDVMFVKLGQRILEHTKGSSVKRKIISQKESPVSFSKVHVDVTLPSKIIARNSVNIEISAVNLSGVTIDKKNEKFDFSQARAAFHRKGHKISVHTVTHQRERECILTVQRSTHLTESVNVYSKSIYDASSFNLLGNYKFETSNKIEIAVDLVNDLEFVRIVPVSSASASEVDFFKDIVVGEHVRLGKVTMFVRTYGDHNVSIEVKNIPTDYHTVSLYRRNCADSHQSNFILLTQLDSPADNDNISLKDPTPVSGEYVEYYVACTRNKQGKRDTIFSNSIIVKTGFRNPKEETAISVNVSKPSIVEIEGKIETSFSIETIVSPSENKRLVDLIKSQTPEIYDQFFDATSNSNSPLNTDKGVTVLRDVFTHEVVRTNLTTNERETFQYVNDGLFVDNVTSQGASGVKPINISHKYRYQIFTYSKNPIEAFKKYIATITVKDKQINYLTYKWKNPRVNFGYLFPDDEEGYPIIDVGEMLLSNAYGLTSQVDIAGLIDIFDIDNVKLERLDLSLSRISWTVTSASNVAVVSPYLCYVIIRDINGDKSVVGSSITTNFIDSLPDEIGEVQYSVIPVTHDGLFDKAGISPVYNLLKWEKQSILKYQCKKTVKCLLHLCQTHLERRRIQRLIKRNQEKQEDLQIFL